MVGRSVVAAAIIILASSLVHATGRTSPLIAVEQQRTSLASRLASQWSADFAALPAGRQRSHEQLASAFWELRSDRLFAASLAAKVEAVEEILSEAAKEKSAVRPVTKALGDTDRDLVYTPVTPCRIVDTRSGAGGTLAGGDTRNWLAANPSGTFSAQGGAASNCAISVKPAAVLLNITVANTGMAPSFLVAWPFGQARPSASTINWTAPGTQIANAVIVPLCTGGVCSSDFSIYAAAATDVVIDVAGYFSAPEQATRIPRLVDANGKIVGPYLGASEVAVNTPFGPATVTPQAVSGVRYWHLLFGTTDIYYTDEMCAGQKIVPDWNTKGRDMVSATDGANGAKLVQKAASPLVMATRGSSFRDGLCQPALLMGQLVYPVTEIMSISSQFTPPFSLQ